MRQPFLSLFCASACLLASCGSSHHSDLGQTEVTITTNMGDITIVLYDDTPQHRDNFLRLCEEGFYDGLLWNRIVTGSTIQCGDPTLRAAGFITQTDTSLLHYAVPAEIHYPRHFHKAGAVGMARQPDDINPKRESSPTQFYIVTGKVYDRGALAELHQFMDDADTLRALPPFTEQQKSAYTKRGGAPHLDGDYTVFGEVVDGMKVVEALGRVRTDERERPTKEVIIKSIKINKSPL